jgi:hypothetical protein
VAPEFRDVVNDVTPQSYLGEAVRVCTVAVERWDLTSTAIREGSSGA